MFLIKLFQDYIRGYDRNIHPSMPVDYTIAPLPFDTGLRKDLSTVVSILFFAIFWLAMENYTDMIHDILEYFQRKRCKRSTRRNSTT